MSFDAVTIRAGKTRVERELVDALAVALQQILTKGVNAGAENTR